MTVPIDLGGGWELSPIRDTSDELIGYMIGGPAGEACPYEDCLEVGRCGGLVRIKREAGKPCWTVEQEKPLTLSPSIQCKCKGQHGHVVDGRYVPC